MAKDADKGGSKRWPIYLGIIVAVVLVTTVYVVRGEKADTGEQEETKKGEQTVEEPQVSDNGNSNLNAKVVVQEFSDYQCPYCSTAHFILQDLKSELGDKLEIEFVNFPLLSLHPNAKNVAIAAECAKRQDKLVAYQDYIFGRQGYISFSDNLEVALTKGAEAADLDQESFKKCYQDKATKDIVEADVKNGEDKGVNSTPTFYIDGEKLELESFQQLKDEIRKRVNG